MTTPQTVQPAPHRPLAPRELAERSPEQIEADLAATRERLAGTIDALVDRVNPKNAARRAVDSLRARVTTPEGQVRPEVVAAGAGAAAVLVLLILRSRRSRRSSRS